MKDYEERVCVICEAVYKPQRKNQKTCCDPECVEALRKLSSSGRKKLFRELYNEKNREYMRKVRGVRVPKPDTIVAIGYADRQREATLKMVGKVRTEL